MRFYTSDTHFGHARIVELSNRPFDDVHHMNEEIIRRWNSVVGPEDHVYHLGDVALGPIMESLTCIRRLNGHKTLILGNHDRPFMKKGKASFDEWVDIYIKAGFVDVRFSDAHAIDGGNGTVAPVLLSHFPYDGDSHDGDRFKDERLQDAGVPLIHGHTHSNGHPVSRSNRGTVQVHVGMDAWNYTPVSEEEISLLFWGLA
jgi:calcineurin-like phosphoesterase family protein